jgi:LysR family transcriptional regulator (chromosome initiation inhibitor)
MSIDFRRADALLAVLETGSFEGAAGLLHLTPSAVSQRVSALEVELGTPLVVRARPCRATRDGQRLVQYLRRARLLEQEFEAERDDNSLPVPVPVTLNHDNLSTWFLPGIAPFLLRERATLDLTLDDQDHTFDLLAQGVALAGISSNPQPMRGCATVRLGAMRYRMVASPAFVKRWFPHGLTRADARRAPLLAFDRKDSLQADFLQRRLGLPPGSYPCHYIPGSDSFMRSIELGIGYGMLPDQQLGVKIKQGKLRDLAPGQYSDVLLYWHAWKVQSPLLERLQAAVMGAAAQALNQ